MHCQHLFFWFVLFNGGENMVVKFIYRPIPSWTFHHRLFIPFIRMPPSNLPLIPRFVRFAKRHERTLLVCLQAFYFAFRALFAMFKRRAAALFLERRLLCKTSDASTNEWSIASSSGRQLARDLLSHLKWPSRHHHFFVRFVACLSDHKISTYGWLFGWPKVTQHAFKIWTHSNR